MGVSDNIVKLRTLTGVTQQQLADIAGVSRSAVSLWEIGKAEPRMGAVQAMADYFGIRKANIIESGGMDGIAISAMGKLYDTEKATKVAEHENMSDVRNFHWFCETLYRKRTGEYFLHGEGGAMSPYGRSCGQNEWCGGEAIRPLTYDEARDWAEGFADPDVYEAEFGVPDEGAEHDLHVIVSEAAWQSLSRAATRDGVTVRAVIERLADEL